MSFRGEVREEGNRVTSYVLGVEEVLGIRIDVGGGRHGPPDCGDAVGAVPAAAHTTVDYDAHVHIILSLSPSTITEGETATVSYRFTERTEA